jgi:mono/diheme cytochrome c family protein
MYLTFCATCHGRDGKGDGPAGRSLKPPPSDLTKISAKNGGTFPFIIIRRYIEGVGGIAAHGTRTMPIWGPLFVDADRDPGLKELRMTNLANYVRALQK